ncbi:transcription elongation factor GreA [Fusibacter bizertensis]|jgi:transcription elongation factor GreA|uniref:Transcription elongation factor GreA n=1 Tax=Fusibacter bizertensis TaxID=1488331 RepID=A0ABT6NFD7_9FIRM|nr:transcription elongation factor GreA [Fusibacter bizertensis]MDH8679139.1 transcription elongation factor GreA [Fusibacter bizertensis]
MKKTLLTESALVKLKFEYDELIEKRHQISDEIKRARGFGDLSENAEYHAAREAQSHNETEILKLKEILENYELVQGSFDKNSITIGSKIKIKYIDLDELEEVEIVTKIESDPLNSKISNESPIGSVLMGKKKGDKVEALTPNGVVKLEVIEIL